jgi:hypothetical protein
MVKFKVTFGTGIHKYVDADHWITDSHFVTFFTRNDDNEYLPVVAYRADMITEIHIA